MDIQKDNLSIQEVAQVEENAKAMQLDPLSTDQMKEIDSLLGR